MPVREAARPKSGEAIVERWWVYQPDDGLVFIGHRPQCHPDKAVVRVMASRFPSCEARWVPIVYLGL